jgi:hypothetical protein
MNDNKKRQLRRIPSRRTIKLFKSGEYRGFEIVYKDYERSEKRILEEAYDRAMRGII